METKLTIKELLDKKIISTKYLSKISGISYNMLRHFASETKSMPDYYIEPLNEALKKLSNEISNITIVKQ